MTDVLEKWQGGDVIIRKFQYCQRTNIVDFLWDPFDQIARQFDLFELIEVGWKFVQQIATQVQLLRVKSNFGDVPHHFS